MPATHAFVNPQPDGPDPTVTRPSDWNAPHVLDIVNADVNAAAAIDEAKLNLNFPTHAAVTIGAPANGLGLVGQQLSIGLASGVATGALSAADWTTFNNKQAALTFPLAPNLGGTGIANAVGSTLTLGAATSITGGGTIALGGFTLTVPATGTAALLATQNVFTVQQMVDGTIDQVQLRVQNHSTQTADTQTWEDAGGALRAYLQAPSGALTGTVLALGVTKQIIFTADASSRQSSYFVLIGGARWEFYSNSVAQDSSFEFYNRTTNKSPFVINSQSDMGVGGSLTGYTIPDYQALSGLTLKVKASGLVGVNIDPAATLHVQALTTTTNAIKEAGRLQAIVSTAATGGANGFGTGLSWYAETATDGTIQQQGLISTSWIDATNASRKAKMSLSAYDTAARLGIEIEADGSATKLGFYGVATVARATTGITEAAFTENAGGTAINVDSTFGGYTVQQIVQALQNIGILT